MGKFVTAIVLGGFIVMSLGARFSYAGEIDILLQKLVEKGVLTPGEAQQIGTETKEQVKKEIAEGKNSSLPAWVQNIKLKGDFRLRYQYDHAKTLTTSEPRDQQRARIRMRLGLESKVNDKILVGIGIASGKNAQSDPTSPDTARSTNWTLGQGFGKPPIALDYAFAQYAATPWLTMIGGVFKNPLWEPGDLIWDTDINPEGGVLKFYKKVFPKTDLFLTGGIMPIENTSSMSAQTTLYAVQPGIIQQLTDTISLKAAASYYGFTGVKDKKLDGTAGTNSGYSVSGTTISGTLINNYSNIVPAVELTIKDPFKALKIPVLDIPYLAFFGEFVRNMDVNDRNTGYMGGFKFGNEKIEKWADWQFRANYAMLGKDAVLDILPDSDRYGGKTGMRSYEAMFDWGLGKNTWLGLDYYYGWQIPGNFGQTQTKPATVVQVDWNMKF
jgi:hypothetical protein